MGPLEGFRQEMVSGSQFCVAIPSDRYVEETFEGTNMGSRTLVNKLLPLFKRACGVGSRKDATASTSIEKQDLLNQNSLLSW